MNTVETHCENQQHVWISGTPRAAFANAVATLGLQGQTIELDTHRRLRGPYTGAGTLMRLIIPGLLATDPTLVARHDVEILTVAPELEATIPNRRATLTAMAAPQERTRFYPRAHTLRIAHGLCELLNAWAGKQRERPVLLLNRLDEADATDVELAAIMLRRCEPGALRLIVVTATDAPEGKLAEALHAHDPLHVDGEFLPELDSGQAPDAGADEELARAFVDSECTSDDPAERAAYEALPDRERQILHDRRADELEARGELSLRLGGVPFHREHGSDPTGAGLASVCAALERCVLSGCYHAVLELGERAKRLLDPVNSPEQAWAVTAKVVTALTALGRPDEAADEYDAASAASTLPIAHLQAAYGRAMLYTRFYDDRRRDHLKAKAWINVAIAIASQLPQEDWRTFNLTLNENGLALIEMHLGDPEKSLALIEDGLTRLDRDLGAERQTLHRSVLRYNRAQLLVRLGRPEQALEAYDDLIGIDPNHSEYHLERAALLRKLGRMEDALADLDAAILLSPPYPEAYYNRGDLLLELGQQARAIDDFSHVLELDPAFADAYLNRASALCDLDDHDAAERDVEAGLLVVPDSAHLLGLRGVILHSKGRVVAADQSYEAALVVDPDMFEIWTNRAALALDVGDNDAAIRYLDRAIALAGATPELLAGRALAQERAGRQVVFSGSVAPAR